MIEPSLGERLIGGAIFTAGGLICLGFAIALLYEAAAYAFRQVPTISDITARQYVGHTHWFVVGVLLFGVLAGALITHFTRWSP